MNSCWPSTSLPDCWLCRGRGTDKQDCLARRVQRRFPAATIVHRLDRDTSGIMLMAVERETHRRLSRQFELREVAKTYFAVVAGSVAAAE